MKKFLISWAGVTVAQIAVINLSFFLREAFLGFLFALNLFVPFGAGNYMYLFHHQSVPLIFVKLVVLALVYIFTILGFDRMKTYLATFKINSFILIIILFLVLSLLTDVIIYGSPCAVLFYFSPCPQYDILVDL